MGLDPAVVQQRVDEIVSQFLYGDPETESVLTEVGDGTAYITDIGHGDVRSEGEYFTDFTFASAKLFPLAGSQGELIFVRRVQKSSHSLWCGQVCRMG